MFGSKLWYQNLRLLISNISIPAKFVFLTQFQITYKYLDRARLQNPDKQVYKLTSI